MEPQAVAREPPAVRLLPDHVGASFPRGIPGPYFITIDNVEGENVLRRSERQATLRFWSAG
jgi:hypothetical protein